MRCSSIVALLVVTASFALGGCAADAEPATGTDNANITLRGTAIEETDGSRTGDVREGAKVADLGAEERAKSLGAEQAREVLKHSDVSGNQRIKVIPSPFGRVPSEKIGALPPTFNPLNQHEQGIGALPTVRTLNEHEQAIGTAIPSVRPLNQYEEAVEIDEAFLPFSHDDKP